LDGALEHIYRSQQPSRRILHDSSLLILVRSRFRFFSLKAIAARVRKRSHAFTAVTVEQVFLPLQA
jgi:hypothetical protein